jgi:hypothetical protein
MPARRGREYNDNSLKGLLDLIEPNHQPAPEQRANHVGEGSYAKMVAARMNYKEDPQMNYRYMAKGRKQMPIDALNRCALTEIRPIAIDTIH